MGLTVGYTIIFNHNQFYLTICNHIQIYIIVYGMTGDLYITLVFCHQRNRQYTSGKKLFIY